MKSVLVALSGLVAPGFAHGLMGHRKAMVIVFVSAYLAAAAIAFTIWAAWLIAAILLVSIVHAGLLHRRLRKNVRWSWVDPLIAFVGVVVLNIGLRLFVVEAFKSPSTSMNPTLELGDHFFINKLAGAPSRGDIIVFGHPCEPERDYVKRVIATAGDTIEVRCTIVYVNGKAVPRDLVEDGNVCRYQDLDEAAGTSASRSCSRYRETLERTTYEVFHDPDQPASRPESTRTTGGSHDFPSDPIVRDCANQERGRAGADQPRAKLVVTNNAPVDRCGQHMHVVVPPDAVFVMGDNRANSNDSRYWGVVPVANVKGRVTGRWLPISRFGAVR